MVKTKLIVEIEEFFAESKAFCNSRKSCTLPSVCERNKVCSAFFGYYYMTNVVNTFTDYAFYKKELLESADFDRSYSLSTKSLTKESELEYFERFSSLVRRARCSEEALHWLKASAVLNAMESVR